ncbi:hypothetical protein [Dickeya sp. CSL RW240]|uniref:hypothetical protein n=1 Tax=Dickeya sp. CSL RW240 TaxID=1224144 RepID=UPI000833F5C5|nr:hypothetical protein [Dickeya sp. CSL RW240]
MKYKLKIIDEWREIAEKKGDFTYINLFDWEVAPIPTPLERKKVRTHFFLDEGIVYECIIMCPILADYPDNTLFKIDAIDSSTFILDTDCEWPDGVSPTSGVVPKSKSNSSDFFYTFMMPNEREVVPAHLEINIMRRYCKEHKKKSANPMITIEEISEYQDQYSTGGSLP